MFAIWRRRFLYCAVTILLLFCSGGLSAQTEPPAAAPGALTVTFLESPEHGLAVVLQTPSGRTFLVDTGHKSTVYDAGRDTVGPFLRARGTQKIDGIALSHPHSDHFGGAPWLIDNFPVAELYDSGYEGRGQSDSYRKIRQQVQDRGGRYRAVVAGEKLAWDDALDVSVLSPPREFLSLDADPAKITEHGLLNANSLVLRVQHGQNVFLFPGDAYGNGQRYLLANSPREQLATTVLCAPHHGFNCSNEFAAATHPQIVVASCLNHYEKSAVPSPGLQATKVFQPIGSRVYVTAWHGNVRVVSDGKECRVTTTRAEVPPEAGAAPVQPR